MTIESFARQYRLKIRHDECGDPVIYGSDRGAEERQLYIDDGKLCLMILNGSLLKRNRWLELGGKLWLGDISRDGSRGVQDVKITGIPLETARLAIKLARVRPKRVMSDARREQAMAALAKANAKPHSGDD